MAKVEGSNPFIRFEQNPRIPGGFAFSGADAVAITEWSEAVSAR
jgi:hypothetical protein